MQTMPSLLEHYRKEHQEAWQTLARLLKRVEKKGIKTINGKEAEQLGTLYLRTVNHLAQMRTKNVQAEQRKRLNSLAARAYAVLYSQYKRRPLRIGHFFAVQFPRLIAQSISYHLLAGTLIILGVTIGFQMVAQDPAYYYTLMPGESRNPGSSVAELEVFLQSGRDVGSSDKAGFASMLFFHNTKVGLLAWVSGIFLGIPSLLLTFYNGMMLGAMTQVYSQAGLSGGWLAWVLPHGITELLAIILCAGAGLYMGFSLIEPQGHSRRWILKERGKECLQIGLGTFPLFFIAALIESFIRQSHLPTQARYLIALVSLIAWIVYFGTGFFKSAQTPDHTS
jgi:uncharacterized membrane protein SpoIIM required for sporulation